MPFSVRGAGGSMLEEVFVSAIEGFFRIKV
jgi:hypothetical protein